MQTIVSIIVSDVVPLRSRGTWQGVLNIIWTMGSASGAPLGGAFLFQVPLTLLAIISVSLFLHLPKSSSSSHLTSNLSSKLSRIDFLGSLTLILTVFSLLFALDHVVNHSFQSRTTLLSFLTFLISFILFSIVELKIATEPFAPKRIIFNRSLIAGYLVNFFGIAAGMCLIFHVSLYLQACKGHSAAEAGVWLMIVVVGGLLGSLAGGLAIQATGKYYILTVLGYGLQFVAMSGIKVTTMVVVGTMIPFGACYSQAYSFPRSGTEAE
ncbi:hypothetical protein H0H93_013496 [Arthromyces matolae]|nr:hypothetical protein H0H93_013496 [Arthromyces matolae]